MESTPIKRDMSAYRELIVPAIMLACVGLYLTDAVGLSYEALLFPMAIIAVLVLALLWHAASLLRGTRAEASADDESGSVLDFKPWLLIGVPLLAVLAMPYIGALVALVVLVFVAQVALGSRALLLNLVIAIAVTAPAYYLFKNVLYVRFPTGLLGPLGLG
jgi:hypothetical protein